MVVKGRWIELVELEECEESVVVVGRVEGRGWEVGRVIDIGVRESFWTSGYRSLRGSIHGDTATH